MLRHGGLKRCLPTCALPAGTAFAASEGGHLFKLEDIALAGWLEWAAQRRAFKVHLVVDKRRVRGGAGRAGCAAAARRPGDWKGVGQEDLFQSALPGGGCTPYGSGLPRAP